MRVIIAGSRPPRSIRYDEALRWQWHVDHIKYVRLAVERSGFDVTHVIEGEAYGFDTCARMWAESPRNNTRIPVTKVPAKWKLYGKSAGAIRNREMVDKYRADALIAITYGTKGTQDMIDYMQSLGKPVYVLRLLDNAAVLPPKQMSLLPPG